MADREAAETALAEDPAELVRDRVGRVLRGDRDGRGLRVGLACAEFNGGVTARLVAGALAGLSECSVGRADITAAWAPGAFELPLLASALVGSGQIDAVVCLGAVIRGETGHYDFVAGECAHGLARLQAGTGIPVIFGVLTTDDADQALARSPLGDGTGGTGGSGGSGGTGGWASNKGFEAAITAVEMARLLRSPWLAPTGARA